VDRFSGKNKADILRTLIERNSKMARRQGHPLYGAKYCANTNPSKKEVHDLDKEEKQCQIDEIIRAGHAKPYDSLQTAHADGYDNCAYCIGGSKR
jgi:hypothetical protein